VLAEACAAAGVPGAAVALLERGSLERPTHEHGLRGAISWFGFHRVGDG